MTKVKKWWIYMSFWNKTRSILTALIALSEGAMFAEQADPIWKWFVLISGVIIIFITHLIEDSDNDGIADFFKKDDDRSNHIDDNL